MICPFQRYTGTVADGNGAIFLSALPQTDQQMEPCLCYELTIPRHFAEKQKYYTAVPNKRRPIHRNLLYYHIKKNQTGGKSP